MPDAGADKDEEPRLKRPHQEGQRAGGSGPASTVSEERQAFVKVVQKGIRAYQSKLAEKAGRSCCFRGRLIEHRPAEEPEDLEESV